MKKWLTCVLSAGCLLSLASCAQAPVEETTGNAGEETTMISYTGMEGGFYVYEQEWQDYISGKREDYQMIAQSTPETVPMETTADPNQIMNELMTPYEVCIALADGSRHVPYESFICAHVGTIDACGRLILQSTESLLCEWVKDGLIPRIDLSEKASLICDGSTDTHTYLFYTREDDTYTKAATLSEATLDEVYRYGIACFAGQTVYIRFDVKKTVEGGSADYGYLFMTEFAAE